MALTCWVRGKHTHPAKAQCHPTAPMPAALALANIYLPTFPNISRAALPGHLSAQKVAVHTKLSTGLLGPRPTLPLSGHLLPSVF